MANPNPYAPDLGDHDAIEVITSTPRHLSSLMADFTAADFDRTYGPGKWPAHRLLLHLWHAELAFGWRLRMALSNEDHVVQPFDQDAWMASEPAIDGRAALDAWLASRALNVALVRNLSEAQRARTYRHPETGEWTVGRLVEWIAGHDRHHLPHFEALRKA